MDCSMSIYETHFIYFQSSRSIHKVRTSIPSIRDSNKDLDERVDRNITHSDAKPTKQQSDTLQSKETANSAERDDKKKKGTKQQ